MTVTAEVSAIQRASLGVPCKFALYMLYYLYLGHGWSRSWWDLFLHSLTMCLHIVDIVAIRCHRATGMSFQANEQIQSFE